MRRLIAVLIVAVAAGGCGARSTTGPAWPKSAGTTIDADADPKDDGGESLDPRQSVAAIASVEASTSSEPDPPADLGVVATAKPADPATAAAVTPPTSVEDPPLEEIVIEINGTSPD